MRVASGLRVAADVGGTFTDIAMLSAGGELSTCKVPSTPRDYASAILEGIEKLTRELPAGAGSPDEVLHASTVATNAILEGKGALTALVTTAGFRDVLELRRIRVPRLYEPLYEKPLPLVPRRRRYELRERLDARGDVVIPLDLAELRTLAVTLASSGVEAVAIAFLHAYANPEHERVVAQVLRDAMPDAFISVSSEVLPEIREYERTSTTVVNAYVGPVVSRYLSSLRRRLLAGGIAGPLRMMQSSGGILDIEQVLARPATVVESGPAAGVVGAARLAALGGYENIITFDMGGTTAKASLVEGGRVVTTDEYEVGGGISLSSQLAKGGGYALKLPVIDVSEVGAGGGSIVRVDAGGGLKVGPESAGAEPGPACYGKGGTEATVTDASVVLGYLNPDALAGGSVPIQGGLAHVAVARVASAVNGNVPEVAHGIFRLANATMMRAVKAVSTYRGRDPRSFSLFAFGGNGGIHAAALAAELGMRRIIVPPAAGVFSAVGLLCADRESLRSGAFLRPVDEAAMVDAAVRCRELEALALVELGPGEDIQVFWRGELRYAGQGFELSVELERQMQGAAAAAQALRARFAEAYRRTYGQNLGDHPVDFVALRVIARAPSAGIGTGFRPGGSRRCTAAGTMRRAYFGRNFGHRETPVVDRQALAAGPRSGPLIIEEYEGTTVVPPDASVALDASGSLVITLAEVVGHAV